MGLKYKTHTRAKGTKLHDSTYLPQEQYQIAYQYAGLYETLKREYANILRTVISSPSLEASGGITNAPGRPAETKALKLLDISERIDLIEESAMEACDGEKIIAEDIIKSAGYHMSYDSIYPMPCVSKDTFYRKRRKFYKILYGKMEGGGKS